MKKARFIVAFLLPVLTFGAAQAGEISDDPAQAKKDAQVALDWLDGKLDSYGDFKVTYNGPAIEMRVTSHIPEASSLAQLQIKGWKILERMSNNKIKVSNSWSQTVHAAKDGREALRAGLTDSAPCFSIYHARDYEMANALSLPFLFKSTHEAGAIAQHLYPKYLKKEFERYGVLALRVGMNSPYHLYNSKPVRSLEDLAGLKVRSGGGVDTKIIAALGATPVSVPAPDAYSALQSGTLDAIHFSDAGASIFRINEVTKYRTINGFNTVPLEYCLSRDFYQKLPADLKVVLSGWAQQMDAVEGIVGYDYGGVLDLAKMVKNTGLQSIKLSDAEKARWRDKLKSLESDWVASASKKGLPAAEFIADIKKLADKYEKMSANEIMLEAIHHPVQGIQDVK